MKKIIDYFKTGKFTLTKALIILGVIILVITGLSKLKCNHDSTEKVEITNQSVAKDSARQAFEARLAIVEDSVRHLQYQRDSLTRAHEKDKKDLKSSTDKVKDLLAKRDDFNTIQQTNEDTLRFIGECKELRQANIDLLGRVDQYQKTQDSLNIVNGDLLDKYENDINIRDSAYDDLNSRYDKLNKTALSMDKDLQKYKKQASKKLVFGPTAGATYFNGSVQPYVGVGVTYTFGRLF